ncbi:Hypothetical_protein [Hexamita inflata]|uniref:Hypothetical_protein n=1 Tax=Hexamita inflata TaxID=28002 RepID=A0AA86Q5U6_9EUKA|nr:Hypothetical protein HINF_LOCUS38756 [Hexamita inflata]
MTYADYNTCFKYCYKGICELSYNALLNINEYTCKTKAHKFPFFWIFFIIIPIIGVTVFTLIFCCCKDQNKDDVETEPTKVDLNQKTKANQNATGLTPLYQQVTLSNGQVGIIVHQSQPQIVTAQQSQNQFHQQPVYQQQIFKNQEEQTVQMPNMQ